MIKSSIFGFAVFFIISYAVTALKVCDQESEIVKENEIKNEKLKYHEDFFNAIRSKKMEYSFRKNPRGGGYYYSFSTVSCIDHGNQTRDCIFAALDYNLGNWTNLCKHNIHFYGYEAKETKIITFADNGIILTTLLKSQNDGEIVLDIDYSIPEGYVIRNCKKFNNLSIGVGESMWNNNKDPIIIQIGKNLFEIFYESPEGSTIFKTTINSERMLDSVAIYPEYSWNDVDEIYLLPAYFYKNEKYEWDFNKIGYAVVAKKFSELSRYNFVFNNGKKYCRESVLQGKLSLKIDPVLNIKNFQIYGDQKEWVVSLTSFKEQKSHILLIEPESMKIMRKKLINLEPGVFKVRLPYSENHKVQFFQSQCLPFVNDKCTIFFQTVDLECEVIDKNEIVADIDGKDCWLMDFYLKFHERFLDNPYTIMYICSKHVLFGTNNYVDYIILRDANPLNGPSVSNQNFELNLKFLGDPKDLQFHEMSYKKLLPPIIYGSG